MLDFDERPETFFVVGGTIRPGTQCYVKREADQALLQAIQQGAYCNVLTARQMGKSSLMVHISPQLEQLGYRTAIVDLTGIGVEVTRDQWYLGLLNQVRKKLQLANDLEAWWQARANLSEVQRFTTYIQERVLAAVEPVVVFIDEVDQTLSLPFTDDFFIALRWFYNERARVPLLRRLSFVLLGVATPGDLIKDRSRTPYNIGQSIDLIEFNRQEATCLEQGLARVYGKRSAALLDRILYWTNGHPYLTQKLCANLVSQQAELGWRWKKSIDDRVNELFLTQSAQGEHNLKTIRRSIENDDYRKEMFAVYEQIARGQKVAEDIRSVSHNQLKLHGLVRSENGRLVVRNRIYERVFTYPWIYNNR